SVTPFGERDALVRLVCRERGLLRGLVKGGRGKASGAVLQPFNTVRYEHFRRLEGQLGSLTLEMVRSRAGLWLGRPTGSAVVAYLSEILGEILPEEHGYVGLVAKIEDLLAGDLGWREVAKFELFLLELAGYGLRLQPHEAVPCLQESALAFVSPASGRAVPRLVAQGYEARLLPLPAVWGGVACAEEEDFGRCWQLCGHFLNKALHGRRLVARERLRGVLVPASEIAVGKMVA
ncbi:MAG: hypothetical protein EBR79_00400, partial [Proteobacteria bacterium]|nr:hypothetical protein [Pseudomonadota bacterium]